MDLSFLQVSMRLCQQDSFDPPLNGDQASVINNIGHSVFQEVSIFLNGEKINQNGNFYPFRAYLEHLMTVRKGQTTLFVRLTKLFSPFQYGESEKASCLMPEG